MAHHDNVLFAQRAKGQTTLAQSDFGEDDADTTNHSQSSLSQQSTHIEPSINLPDQRQTSQCFKTTHLARLASW